MKRLILTLVAAAALAVAMPAVVLAKHNHGNHHGSSHHKHGKSHHARLLRFGSLSSSDAPTGPTGPTGPHGANRETAGTVDKFVNGVLTITLNDNSSISGQVTSATEIECESAQPMSSSGDDDANEAQGDDAQGTEQDDQGDQQSGQQAPQAGSPQAHESDTGDNGDSGDSADNDGSSQANCGPGSLTHGAVVKEAELMVGPNGAVFHSIHLLV